MEIDWNLLLFIIIGVLLLIQTHRAAYHKGTAFALKDTIRHERRSLVGWEDEAKFWRNVHEPRAERARIKNDQVNG